jgi:hypothetical protein
MPRKWLLVPALLVGAGLFLTAPAAKADFIITTPVRVTPRVVVAPQIIPAPIYPRPVVVTYHHHSYEVLYRSCVSEPWQSYGAYRSYHAAREVSFDLRLMGYEVRVVN